MPKSIALLLAFILSIASLFSQQINWIEIDREGGPLNQPVYSIKQDSNDFIWLGTGSGLYRFDGKSYKRWKGNLNSRKFPGITVSKMEIVGDFLWMLVDRYLLVKFNTKTFDYSIVYKTDLNIEGRFEQMCLDDRGNIIVSTKLNRIIWLNTISDQVIRRHDFIKNRYLIQSMHWQNNLLVLGTRSKSICLINESGKIWMMESSKVFPYPGYSVEHIIRYNDSTALFCSWDNAIHLFHLNNYRTTSFVFDSHQEIKFDAEEGTYLCRISDTEFWLGTKSSGIYSFDSKFSAFNKIYGGNFIGNKVFCIFKDNQGRVWVGTDEGVNLFDPNYNYFKTSYLKSDIGAGEIDIYDLKYRGDTFLLGTNLGLLLTEENGTILKNYSTNMSEGDPSVYSLIWDSINNVYFGNSKSLYKVNLKTDGISSAFPKYKHNIESTAYNPLNLLSTKVSLAIKTSFNDYEKIFIACPGYGVFSYSISDGDYFAGAAFHESEYGAFVKSIYFDKNHKMWIADEEKGIYEDLEAKIDSQSYAELNRLGDTIGYAKGEVRFFGAKRRWHNDGISGLTSNFISFIFPRDDGTFWVGTKGSGLFYFNPRLKKAFFNITSKIENPVSVYEDKKHRLWVIDDGQLFMLNLKKGLYHSFGKEYGLPAFDIHSQFYVIDSTSVAITAGNKIIRFNPWETEVNKSKYKFHLVGLNTIDNNYDSLILKSQIEFNESENGISFTCAVLDYSDVGEIVYSYLLDGYNNQWINNGSNSTITFSKLPPGNYNLKIKAQTEFGFYLSDIFEFPVVVKPNWYNTLVFKISLLLLLFVILFVGYRIRLMQILRLQKIRDKIARDLHDDIGSALGAINLYTNAAQANLKKGNGIKASEILEKIGSNSREMSQHMSDIIWAVNPNNDELDHLINRIEKYFKEVLADSHINFKMTFDSKVAAITLEMAERRNIYLILKECLHNSIKYSECEEIQIDFKFQDNKLHLRFHDNGRGFNQDIINPFNGNGFRNMKIRAEEINGKLILNSVINQGTTIELIL